MPTSTILTKTLLEEIADSGDLVKLLSEELIEQGLDYSVTDISKLLDACEEFSTLMHPDGY